MVITSERYSYSDTASKQFCLIIRVGNLIKSHSKREHFHIGYPEGGIISIELNEYTADVKQTKNPPHRNMADKEYGVNIFH